MSSKRRRKKKKQHQKYSESSSSSSSSDSDSDDNDRDHYNGNKFHEAVKNTIIKHEGSKDSLVAPVIGLIVTYESNLKNKWALKERRKEDEKLRKKAGCCFTLCCCACFRKESSMICKILGFCLLSGFIVRFIQGIITYFSGGGGIPGGLNATTFNK
jgi:hypothetical protein